MDDDIGGFGGDGVGDVQAGIGFSKGPWDPLCEVLGFHPFCGAF